MKYASAYYQGEFKFEENCIQIILSKDTTGKPRKFSQNIIFDEVTQTQALEELTLSNRAGKSQTTRFELDSGPGANLLHISSYYNLFSKIDSDLGSSIDPRVSLVAADKSRIKQLDSVRLRVQVGEF